MFVGKSVNSLYAVTASISKLMGAISMLLKHIRAVVTKDDKRFRIRPMRSNGLEKIVRSAHQTFWRQSACNSSQRQPATYNMRWNVSISVGTVIPITIPACYYRLEYMMQNGASRTVGVG